MQKVPREAAWKTCRLAARFSFFPKQKQAFGSPATRKNGRRQSQHAGLEPIPLHIEAVYNDGLPRKRTGNIGNKAFLKKANKPLAHQRPEKMAAVKANMQVWNPYLCI